MKDFKLLLLVFGCLISARASPDGQKNNRTGKVRPG